MTRFVPFHISAEMEAQGYNNQGRGELLGYIAQPDKHETSCRYRISTGGDPNKSPHETCTCRIGLWQVQASAKQVADRARKAAVPRKKAKSSKSKSTKPKRGRKS